MRIRLTRTPAGFVIRDERGRALAYVYFEADETRRNIVNGLTEAEALDIAKRLARALRDPAPHDISQHHDSDSGNGLIENE